MLHIIATSLTYMMSQVTLVAQLGLIGGTMGLFTGFSILSGIEIVYFSAKFFLRKMNSYESKIPTA